MKRNEKSIFCVFLFLALIPITIVKGVKGVQRRTKIRNFYRSTFFYKNWAWYFAGIGTLWLANIEIAIIVQIACPNWANSSINKS